MIRTDVGVSMVLEEHKRDPAGVLHTAKKLRKNHEISSKACVKDAIKRHNDYE